MTNPTAPPPGWYSDAEQQGMNRWWDGVNWTDHRQPAIPTPTPTPTRSAAATGGALFSSAPMQADSRFTVFPLVRAPERAPEEVNKPANNGFTLGIISIFIGAFGILGIIAMVQGILGLTRAQELEKSGVMDTGRTKARWAIALGVISLVIVAVAISVFLTTRPSVLLG
jgi:hypothetical protein